MVSRTYTKNREVAAANSRGFTLLEVMMVTFISSFVFAGVLSAYIFLGRSLSRQANEDSLESRAHLALYYFTQDLSNASTIVANNPGTYTSGTQLSLIVPGAAGSVTYSCDWSGGSSAGVLSRAVGSNPSLPLLNNLSSFQFFFYDPTGTAISVPASPPSSPQINIKQVCMAFTSGAGYAPAGNRSQFTVVSPRVVLKNQALLKDPNDP
jgi:prepilin-type N-terminal cleavage/methylation domain-containing protein